MPTFKYTGDDARYYPALGLLAKPGATAELDEAPDDGRWVASKAVTPKDAPSAR